MKPLTDTQTLILETLREHCRASALRWRDSEPHLYKSDLAQIKRGDQASAFGLGCLTWWMGNKLGMTPAKVLRTFKALEARGLVLREKNVTYQRPLYWWPVGLAAELAVELIEKGDGHA